MQFLVLAVYLLTTLVQADLINDTIVTKEYFPEELVRLVSEYDITDMVYPSNSLRFNIHNELSIFIILADHTNGKRIDKGLYVRHDSRIIKLLDCAREIASPNGYTSEAYFASEDGIYSYNKAEHKAEKYGNLTDNIIGIVKQKSNDSLYVLTKDYIIYKINEEGTKKEEIIRSENIQQIAMDNQHNLYWATNEAVFKYSIDNIVQRIEGLPEKWHYIKMLRPSEFFNNGIMIVVDNDVYIAFVNGTTIRYNIKLQARPTAYATSGLFFQAYAIDKKIYEYNLFDIIYSNVGPTTKNKIMNVLLQIS